MGASYDQKDALGFINLIGLPIKVRAMLEQVAMKLWGGRFESGPSEVFEQFSGSLHFDGKLILPMWRVRRHSRAPSTASES